MPGASEFRTKEDLERAIRAIAREFETDTVFIIGSQAILMSWPEAPLAMRISPEIDAYQTMPHSGKNGKRGTASLLQRPRST
jgi:hypothetical protein